MRDIYKWVLALVGVGILSNAAKGTSMEEAMNLSYLGMEDLPRGIRNNNPGNLVQTNIPWEGKVPHNQNDDPRFEQFYTFVDGLRAMIKDVMNDIEVDGLDNLEKLIYTYAPPHENDTESYIDSVAGRSGIERGETLNPADRQQMFHLIEAMSWHENGLDYIDWNLFKTAYGRAIAS